MFRLASWADSGRSARCDHGNFGREMSEDQENLQIWARKEQILRGLTYHSSPLSPMRVILAFAVMEAYGFCRFVEAMTWLKARFLKLDFMKRCCYGLKASFSCGPRSQALTWIDQGHFISGWDCIGNMTQKHLCAIVWPNSLKNNSCANIANAGYWPRVSASGRCSFWVIAVIRLFLCFISDVGYVCND